MRRLLGFALLILAALATACLPLAAQQQGGFGGRRTFMLGGKVRDAATNQAPEGQLVARYIGAVNTLKEEFSNLAQGGYAPTEATWKLANDQINGDYGVKQLGASLDEIQRLVPGYQVSRLELLAGNDVHVQSSLVQIESVPERHALILPAQDTLFTSGSMTRYSTILQSVMESHTTKPTETAAD